MGGISMYVLNYVANFWVEFYVLLGIFFLVGFFSFVGWICCQALRKFVTLLDVHAAADASSSTEKTTPAKLEETKSQPTSGIEDLFKDSPSIAPTSTSGNPQKDVKNDIMSLFEKVCLGSESRDFHFVSKIIPHLSALTCCSPILFLHLLLTNSNLLC